ncbi:MAG: hypothetical protein Kow006_02800 [Gammaproteobacteria bacterium]
MVDLFERAIKKFEDGVTSHKTASGRRSWKSAGVAPQSPEYSLDFAKLKMQGFLTPGSVEGRTAEEYRIIKRLLLMNAFGKGVPKVERGNSIVVTSALAGEGKTFTSLNLAISIAQEKDSTVLLIDADLTKRSLSRFFGAGSAKGLTDLLSDTQLDIGEVIGRTNVEKLRFIPAGPEMTNATELLASEQMEDLVSELMHRYEDRIILFDSAPLLLTSQAVVITQLVGQVVMVVEEGRTSHSVIREAVSQIDDEKMVGMVLNRCSGSKGSSSYGGYYGPIESGSD